MLYTYRHIYFCTSVKSSWPQYSICHRRVFCFEVSLVDGAGYGDGEHHCLHHYLLICHHSPQRWCVFLFCKQPWTTCPLPAGFVAHPCIFSKYWTLHVLGFMCSETLCCNNYQLIHLFNTFTFIQTHLISNIEIICWKGKVRLIFIVIHHLCFQVIVSISSTNLSGQPVTLRDIETSFILWNASGWPTFCTEYF